jgi:hypothetical protein
MVDLQLFIKGVKVDLFKDETLQIKDKIQDSREFDKLFSVYSNTFNLPATKRNNNLFKHYYNFDIDDGFDANVLVNAVIKINGFDRYEGFIKLKDVKLKENVATSYNVFFTSVLSLINQTIKEDTLRDVYSFSRVFSSVDPNTTATENIWTDLWKSEYDPVSEQNESVKATGFNDAMYCKVLLENRRVFFDDVSGEFEDENGDQYPAPRNFKSYSIRQMLVQIFEFYNLNVDMSIFETTPFNELFFYASPYKNVDREVPDDFEFNTFTYLQANDFDLVSGDSIIQPNEIIRVDEPTPLTFKNDEDFFSVTQQRIIIRDKITSEVLFDDVVEGGSITNPLTNDEGSGYQATVLLQPNRDYKLQFMGKGGSENILIIGDSVYQGIKIKATGNPFQSMKVLDFLTSLFKMFNLSFYQKGNEIKIQPYSDFYAEGKTIDLTKYVDISRSNISRVDNFKDITFKYLESESEATKLQSELSEDGFGNLSYNPKNTNSNKSYNVEAKFNLILPEKFERNAGGVVKYLARNINEEQEEVLNKGLIHFVKTEVEESGYSQITGQYNRLTNIASNGQSLFFGAENDVATGLINQDSLFINYYRDYILSIFNKRSRYYEVECYLPADVINQYSINDTIVINGRKFRIETIDINLNTGKSKLRLNNFPSLGDNFLADLDISPKFLSVTDDAQNQNLTITSDGEWELLVSKDWITPDKIKGSGNDTVVLSIAQNMESSKRINLVNVLNETEVKSLDLIQAENIDPSIVLQPSTAEPTGDAQTIQIQVIANINYTITANDAWISPEFAAGNNDLLLNIDITENPSQINTRTGTVTFENVTESITETLTIVQQVFDPNQLYAFDLGFGTTSSEACGQTTLNEYFVDDINFKDCQKVFVNELRSPAFAGYYSDGSDWVFFDGTDVINRGICV